MIGSHRDLHPSNVMKLRNEGGLVLVDWDAAGPVVPVQEVACYALVFADSLSAATILDTMLAGPPCHCLSSR